MYRTQSYTLILLSLLFVVANGGECNSAPCQNGATCTDHEEDPIYWCECADNYYGKNCEVVSECISEPCLNGGTCMLAVSPCDSDSNDYLRCQYKSASPAVSDTCIDSDCHDVTTGYYCSCAQNYTGVNCQVPVCDSAECQGHGTLVVEQSCNLPAGDDCIDDGIGTEICENGTCAESTNLTCACDCPDGLYGTICQFSSRPCDADPCQNGGTCVEMGFDYSCTCAEGYYGPNCSTTVECQSSFCENGGECSEAGLLGCLGSGSEACYTAYSTLSPDGQTEVCDGGDCALAAIVFSCNCTEEYTGDRCQTLIPEPCASSPCLNSGNCTTQDGIYVCSCAEGFSGINCELEDDSEETDSDVFDNLFGLSKTWLAMIVVGAFLISICLIIILIVACQQGCRKVARSISQLTQREQENVEFSGMIIEPMEGTVVQETPSKPEVGGPIQFIPPIILEEPEPEPEPEEKNEAREDTAGFSLKATASHLLRRASQGLGLNLFDKKEETSPGDPEVRVSQPGGSGLGPGEQKPTPDRGVRRGSVYISRLSGRQVRKPKRFQASPSPSPEKSAHKKKK